MTQDSGLTIIVVTYNSADHIRDLAGSLVDGMAGVDHWRIVVVDNDSHDDTAQVVSEVLPAAEFIRLGQNLGYAAGINAGLRTATPDSSVLVLNPDVRLSPGSVSAMLAAFDDPRVGIAVPRLIAVNGQTSLSLRREPSIGRVWSEAVLGGTRARRIGLSEIVADPVAYQHDHDVEWATGAVMAISSRCRAVVGRWDESFFLYSEEVDYCRRARRAGFRVRFVASAAAEHEGGEYGTNAALWRTLVRNRSRDYSRWHGPFRTALFRAGLMANEALRAPFSPAHRAGLLAATRPMTEPSSRLRAGHTDGFIWFAAQDWWYHNQAHSDFQLMREIARTRPVLVVNSLGLRVPRRGISTHPARRVLRKMRSVAKFVRRPLANNPGFHVMTPVLLPFYGDTAGARFNAWLIRWQVRVVARLLDLGPRPAIGVTIPTAWPVVQPMARSALVYNRSDLHSAFPEADNSWIASLELALMQHSDRVLYVSKELMREDADLVGERAFFLDHGVDLDHFTRGGPSDVSPEIAKIPRPRVGFFGGLDDYVVDMDLLKLTAVALPEMQLVLIGDATCSMKELQELPNVHWLGYRPYEQIPALGRGFDVALMPWLSNEWIRFANPIKLKEYLALGLPVVTTEYPEVEDYRDRVWVARSTEEFPDLIKTALAHPGRPDERRESVMQASWWARAQALVTVTEEVKSA